MYRVLLVEDEPLILEGLCMATPWARYGCTVAGKAYNAEEAERLIVELRPDIVITDINMPGGSGLELIPSYLRLSQAERTRIEKENMGKCLQKGNEL